MTKTGKKPAAKPAEAVAGPSSISSVSGREVAVLLVIMALLAGGAICLTLFG
jgi:hypothetical protein